MALCACDFEEARGAIVTACAEHGSWIVKDGKAEKLDPAAMP